MSILIKGMEMPTSCISCLLNFGEKRPEYGLTIYCPYSDGVISWRDKAFDNGRLASCGIVPVPTPHGRLGDLDEINEKHDKLSRDFCHGYFKSTWDFVCAARKIFYDAPTIIQASGGNEGEEHTMDEFMYGQEGNPNDGSM